jgi:hypothetical protein
MTFTFIGTAIGLARWRSRRQAARPQNRRVVHPRRFHSGSPGNIPFDTMHTLHYKVSMNKIKRAIAITELFLVFPAALFMTALFVRNIQPAPYEPAQTARRLVEWFSARPFLGLDIFLIALPLAAFVIGGATLLRCWRRDAALRQAALDTLAIVRAHAAPLLIAAATLISGCILAVVALHMITD